MIAHGGRISDQRQDPVEDPSRPVATGRIRMRRRGHRATFPKIRDRRPCVELSATAAAVIRDDHPGGNRPNRHSLPFATKN